MGKLEINFRYNEVWNKDTRSWSMDVDVTVDEYENVRCRLVVGSDIHDPMASLHVELPDTLYATIRCVDPHVRIAVYNALRVSAQPMIDCLRYAVNFVPVYGDVKSVAMLGGRNYIIPLDGKQTRFRWYPGNLANTFIVTRDGKVGQYVYNFAEDKEDTIIPLEGYAFKSGFFKNLNAVLQGQLNYIGDIYNAIFSDQS